MTTNCQSVALTLMLYADPYVVWLQDLILASYTDIYWAPFNYRLSKQMFDQIN